jgi:hypothetical protein
VGCVGFISDDLLGNIKAEREASASCPTLEDASVVGLKRFHTRYSVITH